MRAALLVAAAALALAGCGGSDDPAADRLERYLDDAGSAQQPLFKGAVPAVEFLQGRSDPDEPPAEAARRVDSVVRGYEETQRLMARLDPPADIAAEHAAVVKSFDDVAAAYRRIAAALRAGPAAVRELDPGASPGLEQAGVAFRAWVAACGQAADDADVDKPPWLEVLLERGEQP